MSLGCGQQATKNEQADQQDLALQVWAYEHHNILSRAYVSFENIRRPVPQNRRSQNTPLAVEGGVPEVS